MIAKPWKYRDIQLARNLAAPSSGHVCRLEVCRGACCGGGIWVDSDKVAEIRAAREHIAPLLPQERRAEQDWFSGEVLECDDFATGIGLATATLPRLDGTGRTACVFALADHTCALENASRTLNLPWPGLKPFDCATFPVLLSEGSLRWDRTTQSIPAPADCRRPPKGTAGPPLYRVFAREIELAIGKAGLTELERLAAPTTD